MGSRRGSRRFACDRCRAYKLRCERTPRSGKGNACDRCIKAKLVCETTKEGWRVSSPKDFATSLSNPSATSFQRSSTSDETRNHSHSNQSLNSDTMRPINYSVHNSPVRSSTGRPILPKPDHRPVEVDDMLEVTSVNPRFLQRDKSSEGGGGPPRQILRKSGDTADVNRGRSSEVIGPGNTGPDPHHERRGRQTFPTRDFVSYSSSSATTMNLEHPGKEIRHSPATPSYPLSSPPTSIGVDSPRRPIKEALSFCADLVDSPQSPTSPEQTRHFEPTFQMIEKPVQDTLQKTSRFSEILEKLVTYNSPSQSSTRSQPSRPESLASAQTCSFSSLLADDWPVEELDTENFGQPTRSHSYSSHGGAAAEDGAQTHNTLGASNESQEVLLMTALVTTYVHLVRSWHSVMTRLHQLLATGPRYMQQSLLLLPGLQYGGVSIVRSSRIQIQVLLELRADMFQRIDTMLGIKFGDTERQHPEGQSESRSAISVSPFAVSIRETLLYRERARATAGNGIGDLSLKDITTRIKRQIQDMGE